MRSYGQLWERITSPANLHRSMIRAAAGKRDRKAVADFLANADTGLEALRLELVECRYEPLPYQQFRIRDPKPRIISCADFRDRIVHHALCDVCGPAIERRFIDDTYACREGRGMHRAVAQAQKFSRRHRFFLKADIRTYYDTVDIETSVSLMDSIFREKDVRRLWATILRHPFPLQNPGKGLPIGNLTSQWTANLYLDGLDHRVKEIWCLPGYVRYMDDIVVWADDKDSLWWVRDAMSDWLKRERGVAMKEEATRVAPSSEGLAFLGLRVYPGMLRLQHRRLWRTRRLLRKREADFLAGRLGSGNLVDSVRAANGIVSYFGLKRVASSPLEV